MSRFYHKVYYNPEISCKCPDIAHAKVEEAFIEYITKYDDFEESEIDGVSIEGASVTKERELREYINVLENKTAKVLSRKKRINEQYALEEIEFDTYKELLAVLNEEYEKVESELKRIKADVPSITKTPKISREDIMSTIKEHWEYLNNTERMIFLQRFMKKIVVNIEKGDRVNSVKIKGLEFNLSSEFSLKKWEKEQRDKDVSIRKTLKKVTKKQIGSVVHFKRNSQKKCYKRVR